jgi:hypothetical protein
LAIKNKDKPTEEACTDMLRSAVKNQRYRLKQKYFSGVPANEVRTTSPIPYMTNEESRPLVAKWSDPKNMVYVSFHIFFFHNQFAKDLLSLNISSHLSCSISSRKHVKRTSRTIVKSSIIKLWVLAAM